MLADWQIREAAQKYGLIEPFDEAQVQPASYDMRLGDNVRVFKPGVNYIDTKSTDDFTEPHIVFENGFLLSGFALAVTVEKVKMPSHMIARVEGKSSLARLGLFIHVTAGFIDPGFEGHITLELYCTGRRTITLYPGMPICQVSFQRLDGVAKNPYQGKYQSSTDPAPVASRYYRNFKEHGGRY